MSEVELRAIKFNHNINSATYDALNIRRNYNKVIDVPEWVKGNIKPEESPAAYAMKETSNNILTIQAQFISKEFANNAIEIQAIEPPGLIPIPLWLWLIFIWFMLFHGLPIPFNVLGRVAPKQVTFGPNGLSSFVSFELHTPLWNIPFFIRLNVIGVFLIQWRWQYRVPGGTWKDFKISEHKIYTVLEEPKLPWKQQPYPDNQNPWTEALDYACSWAAGRTNSDAAAEAITQKVNDGIGLKYDMSFGASAYSGGKNSDFDLSLFLSYLHPSLGGGGGNIVNCTDCATIVTTFSNLIGCNLHASRMGWYFDLNNIEPIGPAGWGCPNWGCGFKFHEVAWKGGGNYNDPLFDACLEVDGDDDPWNTPRKELLPTNISFTTLSMNVNPPLGTPFTAYSYRERLCANTNNGINNCLPIGAWAGTNNGRRKVT